MYYTPDPNEGKRNNVILILLIIVAVFVLVISVPAQNNGIKRIKSYDRDLKMNVITLSPPSSIKFDPVIDTSRTFLTIKSDSINDKIQSFYIVVYYPKNFDLKIPYEAIQFDFNNGEKGVFYPIRKYKDNRVEYGIDEVCFRLLEKQLINHVILQNIQCNLTDYKNRDYIVRAISLLR